MPSLRTPNVGTFTGGTVAGHESNATITLSWAQLPATANGGVTGPVTDYEICYKKSTDSAWMRWVVGTGFGTPTLTGSVYSAVHGADGAKLDPGTTYQYRVRGLNSVATAGPDTCDSDVDWSNVVSATTPVAKPAAPTLHAAAGDSAANQAAWTLNVNSITIRWTAPEMTGGAPITGYEVWVGTTTVAAGSEAEAALTPTVRNLPPGRTEFISIGLRAETQYFFRVRARNGSRDENVGAWSTEQAGTTTVTEAGTPGAPGTLTVTPNQATGDVADNLACGD